jgi:hypothetical protein
MLIPKRQKFEPKAKTIHGHALHHRDHDAPQKDKKIRTHVMHYTNIEPHKVKDSNP